MNDIIFECPSCKQRLEVSEESAGQLFDCPSCSEPIEVPHATSQPELQPPVTAVESIPPAKAKGRPFRGFISGMLGHATEADLDAIREEFEPMLIDGENLISAYRLVRDMFIFTDLRLILVDRQGLTGKKTEYQSIPYKSIVCFSKESAGFLDLDAELRIWIRGWTTPLVKEFGKDQCVNDVYRVLSAAVLKSA